MGDRRSNEDHVQQISTSIYVTNFLEHFSFRDLWKACQEYGRVIDAYIPNRRSKSGKRFGFVRFIHIKEVVRLVRNLCTIWMGRLRLHANVARFQRLPLNKTQYVKGANDGYKSSAGVPSNSKGFSVGKPSYVGVVKQKMEYKQVSGWVPDFLEEEGEDESDDDTVDNEFDGDKNEDELIEEGDIHFEDPFNIYDLLLKKPDSNNKEEENSNDTLKYPPGFTPVDDSRNKDDQDASVNVEEQVPKQKANAQGNVTRDNCNRGVSQSKEEDKESYCSGHFIRSTGPQTGGSILQVLDDLVKTKMESIDNFCIKNCWGNLSFEFVCGPSVGNSGGILCVWDPRLFRKHNSTISNYFVAIQGDWIPNAKRYLIISVYAPQEFSEKRMLWSYLKHVIDSWSGETILMGDFNEVRSKVERFGTIFNNHNANVFNSFISSGGLVEVPLGGCAFTWCHKSGNKISKLDRFLISKDLTGSCPNITSITLDRYLSDHRLILLREVCYDYGPIPFRMFHYWFGWEGFDNFIVDTWSNTNISDNNTISKFMKKLKYLKVQTRLWVSDKKESVSTKKTNLKGMLHDIDLLIDDIKVDQELLNKRVHVMNSLHDLVKLEATEIAQNAKINWSIEWDENSKYFYGMLNKKRNQHAIRGILSEGIWIEDPNSVKGEFLSHFQERFDSLCSSRIMLDMVFPNRISAEQNLDLERNVTMEEIKRAVWDCGTDKSPGPEGFTFGGTFPKGDLVNEVQSAFNANRQILDGHFILDELIHWCKSKKNETMIFKVDFEKAYDSVRWDYLEDVLNKFGFGSKWRDWIHNCLHSSKGSILVNGSPTGEFYFRKGLKQGDPLSPFLFLLIMESMHLSFQNVVNEGLFIGVSVSSSLHLSHLFYVDDVIFVGQWSESNINTIVQALDCFYKASGLRINLHKSKLMGIAVDDELVSRAVIKMGCSTLKTPFVYLGIKVGGSMSRIKSWDVIVDKLRSRLSKWKMKTFSIGGRLNLLKSVLGSTSIYYISMYKVPSKVLKCLKDIRRNFFIGADPKENKMSWFKWSRVLAYALWFRFIRALHGNIGGIDMHSKVSYSFTWTSIVTDFNKLRNKDIVLFSFLNKRVGNGLETSFWDEVWLGDKNFKTRFSKIYALESDRKLTVASKMNHNVGFSLRRMPRMEWRWNGLDH
nr:RNA-directed DNA polymerase, eukaryota [Tanacetum cinerariifolium]